MKFSTAAVLASATAGAHASYSYGESASSAPAQGYGYGYDSGPGSGSGSGSGSGAGAAATAGFHAPPADVAATVAGTGSGKITYVTQVVQSFVTFCPGPTELVHNDRTYSITEATTFTISDCPCTMTLPSVPLATGSGSFASRSSPIAGSGPSLAPGAPGSGPGSGIAKIGTAFSTQTQKAAPYATGAVYGGSAHSTGIVPVASSSVPTAGAAPVSTLGLATTNGAGKAAALSGAAIVGVLGVAAFLL